MITDVFVLHFVVVTAYYEVKKTRREATERGHGEAPFYAHSGPKQAF